MGPQLLTKKKPSDLEKMLSEAYVNTNLTFSPKEMTQLNLRMKDAMNYFNTSFSYYLYFNNSFFADWINVLYENYSNKIEAVTASSPFLLLVDFDDEVEVEEPGDKMDYEPLFIIIFEKLEISTTTFFSVTNYNKQLLEEFFAQLYENCYLFQLNRKFDSLCFLMSNTDYLLKDKESVVYLGIKPLSDINMRSVYKTEHLPLIQNDNTKALYNCYYFETFLNSSYGKSHAFIHFREGILPQVRVSYIKWAICLDASIETAQFVLMHSALFEMIDTLIASASIIVLSVKLSNGNAIRHNPNFELLLKSLLTSFDQTPFKQSMLLIKAYFEVKEDFSKDYAEIAAVNALVRNMINESFAYRYSNNSNKRKLIIELYQVRFTSREKANESIEDIKVKEMSDCFFYKERSWHYWFIEPKEKLQRNWTPLCILFTSQLKQIGRIRAVLFLIDKYLAIEHKYNSITSSSKGKTTEVQFLTAFYS